MYFGIFMASCGLTYLMRRYALEKSLVAHVNERSSHTTPTPHGGGVAIALTWFGSLALLYITQPIDPTLLMALLWGIPLCVVSFLDDIMELRPRIRLGIQGLVALGGLYALGGMKALDFGLFSLTSPLFTLPFAFLLIVWFINLYNFLDGIDGYAGSEAVFLGVAGAMLFGGAHFWVLIASVLGFLVWNWHKANIFMGDVGSTLLGYNVAIFALYYANLESANLWVWVILFGLFWADATLTLVRRFRQGETLSIAHKKHAYQRLAQAGWRHDHVVLAGLGVNILLFVLVATLPVAISFTCSLVLLGLVMVFVEKQKRFGSC